jgi:serine protease Do
MSYIFKFKNNQKYTLIISVLILLFTSYVVNAKSAPESFANLAEVLSPSVVNISTTTVVEQKSREMPSFPPGSPFEDFFQTI